MRAQLVKQTLVSATLVTVGGNLLGRIFGFGREAILAGYFGTSAVMDTFVLAFTIPELIAIVLFTALPVALIPAVAGNGSTESSKHQSRLFWSGLFWFAGLFGLLGLLLYFFRVEVFTLLAGKLDPDQIELGSELLALLSPYLVLRGIEAYFRSWCFAKKHFVAPATSNLIINLAVMAAVIFFYDQYQIKTLAYGWLAASAVLVLYNGYFAFRLVKPQAPSFNHALVHKLAGLLGVVVLLEMISMAYPLIDRYLAALYLGEGPISALRYAGTLASIPGGLFVAAFNIASFPFIAEMLRKGETVKLRAMYSESVRLLFFGMALVSVGIIMYAPEIVRVAFMRGQFDANSQALTSGPLWYYAIGLAFQAVFTFQMRFYYARQALGQLGLILLVMLAVKSIASVWLIDRMGHEGLAAATALAQFVGFKIATLHLAPWLKISNSRLWMPYFGQILVPLTVVAGGWYGLSVYWPINPDHSLWLTFGHLALLALVGAVTYGLVAHLVGLSEPKRLTTLIKTRLLGISSN